MIKFKVYSLIIAFLFVPQIASAQRVNEVLEGLLVIFRAAAPVGIGIMVIFLLFGLLKYISKTDSPEGREGAKSIIIWGILAIFIVISMWAFVAILTGLIGGSAAAPPAPALNVPA